MLIRKEPISLQVRQKGNVRTNTRIQQLCDDPSRDCTVFDNLHAVEAAPSLSERSATSRVLLYCAKIQG